MLSVKEVDAKLSRLRQRSASRDQRMRDVLSVRQGDISKVFPSMFSEDYPKPLVANFIDVAARDLAEAMAPLPSFNCSATNMPATPKQLGFIRKLCSEKALDAYEYATKEELPNLPWVNQLSKSAPNTIILTAIVDALFFYGTAYLEVTEVYQDDNRPARFDFVNVPFDCEVKERVGFQPLAYLKQLKARTSVSGEMGFGVLRLNGQGEDPRDYAAIIRLEDLMPLLILKYGHLDKEPTDADIDRCTFCGTYMIRRCLTCQPTTTNVNPADIPKRLCRV